MWKIFGVGNFGKQKVNQHLPVISLLAIHEAHLPISYHPPIDPIHQWIPLHNFPMYDSL